MAAAEYVVPDLPVELGELLQQIPTGSVTTYGDLADALGSKSAARWVGETTLQVAVATESSGTRVTSGCIEAATQPKKSDCWRAKESRSRTAASI